MPGCQTVVLTVWEPTSDLFANPGVAGGLGMVDTLGDLQESDDDATRAAAALGTATDGHNAHAPRD